MVAVPAPAYLGSPVQRGNIDYFIPQVWTGEVRKYRDRGFHLATATKTMSFTGKKGDTLKIPLVGRAGVRDRVPGQSVYLQSRTPSQYSVIVDQDKESSFGIDKIVDIQSQYDVRQIYTEAAGYAMNRDLDNALLALRAAIPTDYRIYRTTGTGAGTAAGDPAPLDNATILATLEKMMLRDVPLNACRWIMSPTQVMDIINVDKFVSNDYNLAQLDLGRFESGVIGTLYGLPVHVTNQIGNNSLDGYIPEEGAAGEPTPGVAGSPYLPTQDTGYTTLARGKTGAETTQPFQTGLLVHPEWALLLKQQNISAEMERSVRFQMDILVTTHVYGCKMYRSDHAVAFFTQGVT